VELSEWHALQYVEAQEENARNGEPVIDHGAVPDDDDIEDEV